MNGIDSPVASCIDLYMSDRTGDSLLMITGGVLEVADRFMIGRGDGNATVVMSGGIIDQMVATEYTPPEGGRMDIGNRTGHSSLQITGGEIHIDGGFNIGNWESRGGIRSQAFGHIQLDGGLIDADWVSLRCDDTNLETRGTIDITGDGVLQIRGNAFLDVDYGTEGEMNWYGGLWFQDYLDLGWISGYGKVRGVFATYDAETDITTLVADIEGPERAYKPYPRSGTTDVPYDTVPYWLSGDNAVQHDVYIGTDFNDVNQADISDLTGVYKGRQDANSYTGGFEWGQTCYWRVDEVEADDTIHKGYLWVLTVADHLVADDFESYNDLDPNDPLSNRIFNTWLDGYEQPTNGSIVGYADPPFTEQTIIHSGRQAMPFFYDNSGTATHSEAELTLSPAQDWTKHGVKALVLWFYGDPTNAPEQMYVKLNDAKVVYPGDADDLKEGWWQQWNIDLASFGVDLQNVTKLSIGFGDEANVTPSGSGKVLIDDIRLYRSAPELPEVLWFEAESADTMTAPMQILSNRADASNGQYIAVAPGNNSMDNPPADGHATYVFDVKGGVYKIVGQVIAPMGSSDSFWFRIQGATTNTSNHSSGWVRWDGIEAELAWHWDEVHSSDDNDETVYFTLAAGTYSLEIAYAEDGTSLDGFVITDDMGLEQTILPDMIP